MTQIIPPAIQPLRSNERIEISIDLSALRRYAARMWDVYLHTLGILTIIALVIGFISLIIRTI